MPLPSRRRERRSPTRRCGVGNVDLLESRRLLSGTTYTVNAAGGADYTDLESAIVAAPAGSTLLVSPGTYTAHTTTIDPTASVFWIDKPLTIESTGGAAVTTLVVPTGQVQNVLVSSSDVRVEGFSLHSGEFCADVQDFLHGTTLTNVVLRDLDLTPDATTGDGHGIYLHQVSDSVVDGCAVGLSYANGIFVDQGSDDDVVENCSFAGTVTQHAIAVESSTGDQILDDTVTGSAFDGIILVTATNCRVTGNDISGHRVDGITLTNDSDDDLVSLNTVVSDGYAAGRPTGTGIWLNDDSDGDTVFANAVSGSPECGIDVFNSSDSLIDGNDVSDDYEGGIFVYSIVGNATYPGGVPTHTVVDDNYVHANPTNAGVILRGAVDSDVERNVLVGTYAGTAGSSTDGGLLAQGAVGVQFVGNTVWSVSSGIDVDAASTGVAAYRNRELNVGENYAFAGAAATFDASYTLGGNYWGGGPAVVGDPSVGTPYTHFVYDAAGDLGGGFVDHFPYADESLGQSSAVTVTEPDGRDDAWPPASRRDARRGRRPAAPGRRASPTRRRRRATVLDRGRPARTTASTPGPPRRACRRGTDYAIQGRRRANSAGTSDGGRPAPAAPLAASGAAEPSSCCRPAAYVPAAPGGSARTVAWAAAAAGTPVDVQVQVDGGSWTTLADSA